MRISLVAILFVGVFAGSHSPLRADQGTSPAAGSAASQIVTTYCAGCHNGVMRSPSGALLDRLDGSRIAQSPDAWTRAYRQIQAGTMPPVGAPRPDRTAYDTLLASIDVALGANVTPPTDAVSQEIAVRLAMLLWDGAPDLALLADAKANRLTNATALERQITRMLNDERARAFVERFFIPWLGLDQLEKADPDKAQFPDYDVSLRDAMATETRLFILGQLREDRDPIDLWTTNYTFVNGQLARHYGIAGVTGTEFRRVASPPERTGLLGQGSVLMVTSRHPASAQSAPAGKPTPASGATVDKPAATYTSPASRALWVRRHFLGAAAPNPFPGAEPVNPELPITPQTRTLPAEPCVNCHRNFFPLGYALENFDPIGGWRTRDQIGPIDASGTFVDGTATNGVVELRNVLLQRPDAFRTAVTEQLLNYDAGRPINPSRVSPDTLVRARQILRAAAPVRWSSIIAGIVRTKPLPGQ